LSNHKFDVTKIIKTNQHKHDEQRQSKNKQENEKTPDEAAVLSFAQMEGRCYCCGKGGHKSPNCRDAKDIKREDWAIHKSLSHAHSNTETSGNLSVTPSSVTANSEASKPEPQVGWAGVHCSFAQAANLKDLILLDSDSMDTVFCNPNYVTNIRDTKELLQVLTNGGVMKSQQKCDVPHLGECWFKKDSITNIIAMCDMRKKFSITMDTNKAAALLVHLPNKAVKFKEWPNGLYAMNPEDLESFGTILDQYQMIQTIEENMKFLSPRQQGRARKARKLYHATRTPRVEDLKAIIRMDLIRNNQVTTAGVNLATKAYGPDIGTIIKAKSTRSRPAPVTSNLVEIPGELLEVQKDVIISIDGMTVNSLKFLTTILHQLFYQTAQYVPTNVALEYAICMDELMAVYKQGQFTTTEVHCDNEFHKLMDTYATKQDPPLKINYASA
jgi:hypothetical protein